MTGVKETQCTYCIHREVCMYKKDILAIQSDLNRVTYIFPVDIACRHYERKQINGCEVF